MLSVINNIPALIVFAVSSLTLHRHVKEITNLTTGKIYPKNERSVLPTTCRDNEHAVTNSTIIYSQDFTSPNATRSMLTNSTLQVTPINGKNWLQLGSEGAFTFSNLIADTFVKMGVVRDRNLPENFSFEVDVMATTDFVYKTKELATVFAATKQLKTDFRKWGENRYEGTGIKVGVHPIEFADKTKGQTRMMMYNAGKEIQKVEKMQRLFNIQKNSATLKFVRSFTQLTVFLNGEKIWDVQDAFNEKVKYNAIIFTTGAFEGDNKFYIGNIKLTVHNNITPQ
jgi:hypothetical protein